MSVPKNLRYSATHEWALLEGDTCTIGITAFAVEQLTDIVYCDLKKPGTPLKAGERFGEIESVKAVSDLYAPVAGEISAVNEPVAKDPASITADPYVKGWMIKMKVAPGTSLSHLLTPEQYETQIAAGGH